MKKHTLKIVFAAYLVIMVAFVSIFNGNLTDHSAGDGSHVQSEIATTHEEAVAPHGDAEKKAAEKLAYLNEVLETISKVDNTKPLSSE